MESEELLLRIRCRVAEVQRKRIFEETEAILEQFMDKKTHNFHFEIYGFEIYGIDLKIRELEESEIKHIYIEADGRIVFTAFKRCCDAPKTRFGKVQTFLYSQGTYVTVLTYIPGAWEECINLERIKIEFEKRTYEKKEMDRKESLLKKLTDDERSLMKNFAIEL